MGFDALKPVRHFTQKEIGVAKAMYRRVLAQAQPVGKDEVQQCLNEVCRVKNDGHKAG